MCISTGSSGIEVLFQFRRTTLNALWEIHGMGWDRFWGMPWPFFQIIIWLWHLAILALELAVLLVSYIPTESGSGISINALPCSCTAKCLWWLWVYLWCWTWRPFLLMAWDVCDQFLTWGSPDHRNSLGTWRLQLHHLVAPGSWILSVPADKDSILPDLGHLLLNGLFNCFMIVHIWQWWFIVCYWWQLLVCPARDASRTYGALLPTVVAV